MSFLNVLDRMIRRPLSARQRRNTLRSFRPFIEFLELRCVPTTVTPTTFADGVLGSGSLRDAVLQFNADASSDDDIIQLLAGTYHLTIQNAGGRHETAGLTGDLNLTQTSHHWIIQGAGTSTIIDAGQLQDRAFQIVNPGSQVVFRDLVIQGGLARDNGADGALAWSTDSLGGGILNNGGNVTLDHVVLTNNVARGGDVAALGVAGHNGFGGGIYSSGGALTLAGATLANNQVSGGRGGNHNGQYAGDGGSASGGGLYATGGSLDISDSMVTSNRGTGGRGGDGYLTTGVTTFGHTYRYYTAGGVGGTAAGGGLYVNGGSLTIASSAITTNQAAGGSAGLGGSFNGFGQAGGLYTIGTLTVSDSTLSSNTGGGIYNGGTLTVSNSTLSGNSASFYGGAIYNGGTLTVSNSTLSGNSTNSITFSGGAIYNGGTLTVSNSTLSGNSTNGFGGAIYNRGTLTVSNSTLSGNSALLEGGGIFTDINGTQSVTLTNVTLTANRANTGGGCCSPGGGLIAWGTRWPLLHNTLIAGNFRGATGTTRDDVFGALDAGGDYNLIGDGTGMTGLSDGVNGNQVGSADAPIDPLLGPLQNNGGPTRTHALLPGHRRRQQRLRHRLRPARRGLPAHCQWHHRHRGVRIPGRWVRTLGSRGGA